MCSQRLNLSQTNTTDEECFAVDESNFQEYLPRLKELLKKNDGVNQLRAVETLLVKCVTFCTSETIGETVLHDAIPVARELFFQTIEDVERLVSSTTNNVLDDVRQKLERCENLLEYFLQCILKLGKFEKFSASKVRGILDNLVEVTRRSFEHVRSSEEMYGILFNKVAEKLTKLFRKTNELQKSFCNFFERFIVLSKDVEAELTVLAKVVNITGETCLLVDGLDMKTVAESWQGFTKISIAFCNELKKFLPSCVTPHLKSLADAVNSSLRQIVKTRDKRLAERSIKLQKHFLKLLQKLCVSYSGYLGDDTASAVVRLLVQLHRYSSSCLKLLDVHIEITECFTNSLTSGTDHLLDSVIKDPDFKEEFFKFKAKETSDDIIGYHILTVIIINKLIASDNKSQLHTWRKSPNDILEVAWANINALEDELLLGKISLGILSLYDATLTSICGVVISTTEEDFSSLEILLLKNLLGGNIWSSVLAADVWCFLNKSASPDLSYDHLVYLMSVYETLAVNRRNSTEVVILGNLISRLYGLSLSETKNRLIDRFQKVKAHFWTPLKNSISKSDKMFLSELTSTDAENITEIWNSLMNQPSAANWYRLINQLLVIGTFNETGNKNVIKIITNIWKCIGKSMEEFDGVHLNLITQLIIASLEATQTIQGHDEELCFILITLTSLIPNADIFLRSYISNYLKESTENFGQCGRGITKALGKLYCYLLEDENSWSREEALESFAHVTNTCYNDELVGEIVDIVAGIPQIRETVSLYLSRSLPTPLPAEFSSMDNKLREILKSHKNNEGSHVCPETGGYQREEKRRKLICEDRDMSKTPDDLRERIIRLSNDIDYLLSRKDDLSQSSLDKLEEIFKQIVSINKK